MWISSYIPNANDTIAYLSIAKKKNTQESHNKYIKYKLKYINLKKLLELHTT